MHTPLGSSLSQTGEEITQEKMDSKPDLLKAKSERKNDEAVEHDTGITPGDKMGKLESKPKVIFPAKLILMMNRLTQFKLLMKIISSQLADLLCAGLTGSNLPSAEAKHINKLGRRCLAIKRPVMTSFSKHYSLTKFSNRGSLLSKVRSDSSINRTHYSHFTDILS